MRVDVHTLSTGKKMLTSSDKDTLLHFTRCHSSHDCFNYERYLEDLTLEEEQLLIAHIMKNGPITHDQQFII